MQPLQLYQLTGRDSYRRCSQPNKSKKCHPLYVFLFHSSSKEKVSDFPVPSWDVTKHTLPGREQLNYSRPGILWLVTSRMGTGKTIAFFYSKIFSQNRGNLPARTFVATLRNFVSYSAATGGPCGGHIYGRKIALQWSWPHIYPTGHTGGS